MRRSGVSFKRFDSAMQNKQRFSQHRISGTGEHRITRKYIENKEYAKRPNLLIFKEQVSIYSDGERYSVDL